jgi:putative spermidine/putrescine transport system permease protein
MTHSFNTGRALLVSVNVVILMFMLAPMAIVFVFAVNPTSYIQFPPVGFSLRWFEKFFATREFVDALKFSLQLAFLTTVLATLIGACAAIGLNRGRMPGSRALASFFLSPLMMPSILTGLGIFQMFLLLDLGRPFWGLLAGHTLIAVPYVVRTTLAVLENFDVSIEEAAQSLGASPLRTFFEVTLPLSKTGIIAGAVFAFVISFDQFPISLFLVDPGRETLPIRMFNYLLYDFDGTVAAGSIVSIAISLLVVLVLDRVAGLQPRSKPSSAKQ